VIRLLVPVLFVAGGTGATYCARPAGRPTTLQPGLSQGATRLNLANLRSLPVLNSRAPPCVFMGRGE
jgi:hypothetical protein